MSRSLLRHATPALLAVVIGTFALGGCKSKSPTSSPTTSRAGAQTTVGAASNTGSTGSSGSPGPVDVCSLISVAQLETIIGHTYTTPTPAKNMCSWSSTDASFGLFIIITPNADDAAWQDALRTLEIDGGSTPVTVGGVGDRAAGSGIQFDAQAGSWIVDVHGGDPDSGTGVFTKSAAVAQAVIAALH